MDTSKTAARHVTVRIVHGFVDNGTGGNPAGVVLDADALSEAQMLAIAARVGLSETAFVSASRTEGFKLDFFTPNRRIPHCGHATIAAFSLLDALDRIPAPATSKETVDGPRRIQMKGGAAFMEQKAPGYAGPDAWAAQGVHLHDVLDSLGLDERDLDPGLPPQRVDTGNGFLVIGVADAARLAGLTPDFARISRISEALDLVGYYVFTRDRTATSRDATTRMFAPAYAIEEEAATGMAAGPLACLLHDFGGLKKNAFLIEQGTFMVPPSSSLIEVELDVKGGTITGLMAGGHGALMGSVDIPI